MRACMLLLGALLLAGGGAGAEPLRDEGIEAGGEAPGSAVDVKAAPGGGDMVILGPESRYVTRGAVDGRGRVKVGCERDGDDSGAVK
jgi:hypothetical protein